LSRWRRRRRGHTSADGSAVAADVGWAGTRWGAGKRIEPTTVARHQSATLSMLSCLDRLALQSNSQATARQKEIRQRDPNRFNGAYFRGCKLVFACAIKWLAPVEDVARLLVSLDFAVSLPQPEGDSEFVRRLQAADSRLQMLSKLVLRRRAFSGASVDAGRLTTALHSSCIGKALSLGNRAGGAGRAEPRTRVHHTGGCGGWPCVLFCWGGRCSAPRRAAALTPGRKGQPGRLKCTSGVKLREGAAP